jgi:MarR family transcriptional regulator, organic hydroperoxide resistance regulator
MAGRTEKAEVDALAARSRDLPPLEERATFLIHRFNAKLSQACQPVFAALDLDLYSSRILVALTQHEMLSVGALVELMALPQSTISHQLKRLDKIGYIQRTRSLEDNRSVEVRLTPLGHKVAETCNQLSREIYMAAVETFSDAEIETLSSLLKRMYVNLPTLSELRP